MCRCVSLSDRFDGTVLCPLSDRIEENVNCVAQRQIGDTFKPVAQRRICDKFEIGLRTVSALISLHPVASPDDPEAISVADGG